MYLTNVENLLPGMILGKSIYNDRSELMLAAGYEISDHVIKKLKKLGFQAVYVTDELTRHITPQEVITDTLKRAANQAILSSYQEVARTIHQTKRSALKYLNPGILKQRLNKDTKINSYQGINYARKLVGDMVEEIVDSNISFISSLPIKSASGREYQHAVDTTVLTLLIGKFFDLSYRELKILGTAAILHDIGKSVIPAKDQLDDAGSEVERKQFLSEHPTYSMLLLQGNNPGSYKEQFTVHHHHEHLDGTGYPLGLRGENISPARKMISDEPQIYQYAHILAVANEYDNLITGSEFRTPMSPEDAMLTLVEQAGFRWNSFVVQAVIKIVDRYPVGVQVTIKASARSSLTGYRGVVAQRNPRDPSKPLLILTHNPLGNPITPAKVDLSREHGIKLELLLQT